MQAFPTSLPEKKKPGVNFTICLALVLSKETDRTANSYISEEQEPRKEWKVLDK